MKIFFFLTMLILLQIQIINAQSIGIGTNTPGARLDIARPAGDTPTLNIRGTTNISHFNIGPGEYTYIRGGKEGSQVLINDFPGSGRIGFGTPNPLTRFHFFNGSSGNFFPNGLMALEGNDNTYMNILAPNANETGLLFGKTSDAVSGGIVYNNPLTLNGLQFRTNGNINRMVINSSGNVGIGVDNPEFKLDVIDRMRIRSGGGFSSAGLYLNKNDNSASPAFIGMHDDNHVGFWGSGMGWGFTMNTNNGALRVNGNEGVTGQVLQSNGGGNSASWSNATNQLYHKTFVRSNATSFIPGASFGLIPAMSQSITVPGNAKLMISFSISIYSVGCTFCTVHQAWIDLRSNGARVNLYVQDLSGNDSNGTFTGNWTMTVGSGTYNIELYGRSAVGNVRFGCTCDLQSIMTIQVVAE